MKNPSLSQISTAFSSPRILPDGSFFVRRSSQEIEVWGVNIGDHFMIRVEPTDATKMDIVYLENGSFSPKL